MSRKIKTDWEGMLLTLGLDTESAGARKRASKGAYTTDWHPSWVEVYWQYCADHPTKQNAEPKL
jgi:hypothetical protein